MKQNIFTLEEIKKIKRQFLRNSPEYFICLGSPIFKSKWDNYSNRREIMNLGIRFMEENSKWYEYFSPVQEDTFACVLFLQKSDEKYRQIRLAFLNWLIENTES